ncbi:hydroxyethylthiazole kinase [Synergistaceae bacterium OttesenSCG-928-I11]|nr:hydroxyethylthiazole kinase [Synergistaceae bacterium OttesenSCG-928-I11]
MRIDIATLSAHLEKVRTLAPLVHHITNYVTVNDCANATLAIGASPVMADDLAEAPEMTRIASALVINMGTLNARTIGSMLASGSVANACDIPVVFDPVGVGATAFRSDTAARLLREIRFSVIRGNASEIMHIAGMDVRAKGVDTGCVQADFEKTISMLQCRTSSGTIYAATGATDVVVADCGAALIENGHPAMARITGTGCMCTSLIASFCGAGVPPFEATVCGIAVMGIAGELAYERTAKEGVGSMRVRLIDEIGNMSPETLERRLKITCEKR